MSAVAVSVAAHLMLLGGFASVHLGAPAESESDPGTIGIHTVYRPVEQQLITPKPEIRVEDEPDVKQDIPVEENSQAHPVVREEIVPAPVETPLRKPVPVEDMPPPVIAEFFGRETAVTSVCFVVDCSGSMYGRLGLIQRQMKNCIASLRDTQSFYLIFFLDGDKLLENGSGKTVPAAGYAKAQAFAMIDRIYLEGRTNARQAIERAMKIRDARGRPVELIYFLTDGFDLQILSSEVFCGEIQQMRKKYAPSSVIHTIGLWVSLEDQNTLQKIAEITGGEFIHVE